MSAMGTAPESASLAAPPRSSNWLRSFVGSREFGILAFLLIVSVVIGIARPTFLAPSNILNMGRQMAVTAVMAVAMTFLITTSELDLSVGSVLGFCSMSFAILAKFYGMNIWLSLVISILVAALLGWINGAITTRGRIPAFITTLGMLYIVRGITLLMSPWPVSQIEAPLFYEIFSGRVLGIPVQIFWMLGIVILGDIVMKRTQFGYAVRATGSNRSAAMLSGIPVNRVKVICFVMVAVAAAFAGGLQFAHLGSVNPTAGQGAELTVIAAVVIGGTALFGGDGTVWGTFLGAALLTVIRNGLVQLGGEGRLQEAFLGAIIIVAVLIHTHLRNRAGGAHT